MAQCCNYTWLRSRLQLQAHCSLQIIMKHLVFSGDHVKCCSTYNVITAVSIPGLTCSNSVECSWMEDGD